ncbi:MAG: hypothetical protein LBG15_14360 [Dysgonamonadaceae bacterium]|jgi:hypothetical protein|nr:hypothetical protein [Dysgonamonadaceae bacterium]
MDFEKYLNNALKQYGYLFPETDSQIAVLEKNLENIHLPEEFEIPDFVFDGKRRKHESTIISINNSEGEKNWAIAARDGKDISDDIKLKMKSDKEDARKKQNGDRQS